MAPTSVRPGYSTNVNTPYLNGTNRCLRFFYMFTGNVQSTLTVRAKYESGESTTLVEIPYQYANIWSGVFTPLPEGILYVNIEGRRGNSGVSGMAIDDYEIADCSSFQGKEQNIVLSQ